MEKKREEIERALLAAVQSARAAYEKAKASRPAVSDLVADLATGNPDRTLALHRESQATSEIGRALVQYRDALRRFTDFVVSGKLPKDG